MQLDKVADEVFKAIFLRKAWTRPSFQHSLSTLFCDDSKNTSNKTVNSIISTVIPLDSDFAVQMGLDAIFLVF